MGCSPARAWPGPKVPVRGVGSGAVLGAVLFVSPLLIFRAVTKDGAFL